MAIAITTNQAQSKYTIKLANQIGLL